MKSFFFLNKDENSYTENNLGFKTMKIPLYQDELIESEKYLMNIINILKFKNKKSNELQILNT